MLMKKAAQEYYSEGYNCCESIIMSANKKYNLNISNKELKLASCINNGFGVGSLCGSIIGAIMVLGLVFEKKEPPEHSSISHIRMDFIDEINSRFKTLNCSQICKLPIAKDNCNDIVCIVSEVLDEIIIKYK